MNKNLLDIPWIIGYLDQASKMKHFPEKLPEIILFLAKELKSLKDLEQNKLK